MYKNKDLISTILSDYELALTKIILYCISELPFPLGIGKIISVLKGTKSTFAINNQLQHLVTFSLLSSFSKTQLTTIIEVLILAELIKIENISVYGNMPVLKLTEKGSNCLNGKEMLLISFLDALTDNEIQEFNESENALFLKLKAVRRTCAEENDLPAFIICGDQVLREICFKKPTDKQSLLAVKGIGEKFTDKYGSAFIQSIQTHLQH